MAHAADPLERYWSKRDFAATPEPRGERQPTGKRLAFVIQKHHASHLHYDFRLEIDGVMRSWAVPKGPSLDPKVKRMAVQVEDHPISYNSFEGTIPKGHYGAGTVIVWDRGWWEPSVDPLKGLADGKLAFKLHGQKLAGAWELVRIRKPGQERQDPWLLFKKHDRFERASADFDVVSALPGSAVSQPIAAPPASARARLPKRLAPQLATLASEVPSEGEWRYEIKFDGYRILTRIEDGQPALITRSGHDWSAKLPALVKQLASMGVRDAWIDGEIVVMNDDGVPSFSALQNAFDSASTDQILYFVFDLPYLEGRDLRPLPLVERRRLLADLVQTQGGDRVRFSADFEADPHSVLQSACRMKLEGIIAKRADAPYVSERSAAWLKLKCTQRQEFVIVGFTDRQGDPKAQGVGSLMLGVHDADGELVSVGSVGTGWSASTAVDLKRRLLKLESTTAAFDHRSTAGRRRTARSAAPVRWVAPQLVAEVSFAAWTPDGRLRHASFEGLRLDKPARHIVREHAIIPSRTIPRDPKTTSMTKVSHPERVIDASTSFTKLDLVRYYEAVAAWMLPHLRGRPCSLVRAPSGIGGEVFFQKHFDKLRIPEVKELDPSLWPAHAALLEVGTVKAIASAAQMNVIEFHTWNSLTTSMTKPNRMVFDLDPGEGVAWKAVQEGAALTRSLLQQLGLESWLKTSGGKGLHVVVPLAPRHDWATVHACSKAIVEHLAHVIPDRFVAKSGPSNRVGKIFVDYLRNAQGATTVAAYSARARPGLGVSMPVAWEALESVQSGSHWTIANTREHLSLQQIDPWADYGSTRQSLSGALKTLGLRRPATGRL